ncbi:MAG TPA: glycosyltransferase [Acidimicrobiales bacterium]|jgi:glycosyltransferase involved in cell wall biosynthesis/GT2 family glycosyltransferase|nr:glycosyltransferase [Acidimicrobiales bacterium]
MTPNVDVVVVAFGAPELLEACLTTLGDTYPVLVVDNSSDAGVRAVAEHHGASYVDPGANLGFAGGVNLGLAKRERSSADVLLLNPDASISPEGVSRLAHFLHASDGVACVAPTQVDADGRAARVGWPFPTPMGAWIEAVGFGALRRHADFMIGSVLLIRATALDDVGPFDERFFLYAEETDWQQRARRLGWRAALCREVTAVHVGAGTGGDPARREVLFHASEERYVRKYHGPLGWWLYRAGAMVGALIRALVLRGDRSRLAAARFHLYRRGPTTVGRRLGLLPDGEPPGTAWGAPRLSVTHVVVTDAFAGVERYVCRVADELARRGHDVTVIGGDPRRMRDELDDRVAFGPARSLPQAAWTLGRPPRTDLVHVHMTKAEMAAWLADPRHRAPIVATRHFARERGSSPPARAAARLCSRAFARDIAISRFVAGTVRGPTVLIPNGVPERPAADLRSPVVVMMQRLDTEKLPDIGIRAWARSRLADRGWRLVVAGVGDLGPALARLADDLGVAGSVCFAGQVEDTDRLLSEASILLAPAPAEPFGLSVVEAMAHGVPVVAADGGAHRETVGQDGVLVPAGDPEAAAAALVTLSRDRALRLAVGERLRRRQQELFSLERHVDELESLYRLVLDEAGPR